MINRIVKEINSCLDNECFIAALYLSLTLPDICGKAEYPNERESKNRYINWFNEFVVKYEINHSLQHDDMPLLDGESLYVLRCNSLHEGSQILDVKNNSNRNNKLNKFVILIEEKNEFEIYGDYSHVSCEGFDFNEPIYREMTISLRRLCLIVSSIAARYYRDNSEKFSFINSTFKDVRN